MTFIGLCPTLAACDTEPTEPGTVAFGTPGGATGRLAATNGLDDEALALPLVALNVRGNDDVRAVRQLRRAPKAA